MSALEPRYRRVDGVVARRVMDEDLLVPIRGELADLQKVFSLNAVGAVIWALLEAPRTAGEIAEALDRDFQVTEATARTDAEAFLAQLMAEGLAARDA